MFNLNIRPRCYKFQQVCSCSCIFDCLIYLKIKHGDPNGICSEFSQSFVSDSVKDKKFLFY